MTTFLETSSFAGGEGSLQRLDLVSGLHRYQPGPDEPKGRWRSVLVLVDGREVKCQATMGTMRRRLLTAAERAAMTDRVQEIHLRFG